MLGNSSDSCSLKPKNAGAISRHVLAAATLTFLALFVTLPTAPARDCHVGSASPLHVSKPSKAGEAASEGIEEIPVVIRMSWLQEPPLKGATREGQERIFSCAPCLLDAIRFRPPPLI